MTKEYILDGSKVTSLEAFYDAISDTLIPGADWGHNLDAFNDILRGGFVTPEEGFILRWRNSDASRVSLSHAETVRQLQKMLKHCHPTNRDSIKADLSRARKGEGATVFEWLVEILRDHGVGGEEAEDGVHLILD